ncbi:MAG: DUF2062 domain-containing protein [Marivirga sp.]|nr:DUF2062 domain-containing protein [Marivirga sp.]
MKFSRKHFTNVVIQALSQGITPRKLALTCSLGVVIGIFPIFGTTTLLCLGLALLFRLNIPLIQLVNYLVAPLQLILVLPFIKLGTYVFQLTPFPYSSDQLMSMFRNDFWLLLKETGLALTIGIGVWIGISIPLFFLLFYVGFWIFSQWRTTRQREL